jgi:DNA-binding HxlR family transcriptional regulator
VENLLYPLGWNPGYGSASARLAVLPNVLLPALVLLVAGAGAFLLRPRPGMSTQDTDRQPRTDPAAHPTNGLDDIVHQRHRLGILTITAEARADFGYLRDALGLTAGNLSRHLTVLEEAGLIQVEKGYAGRRPRTWVRITSAGRAALAAEVDALAELVRRHRG